MSLGLEKDRMSGILGSQDSRAEQAKQGELTFRKKEQDASNIYGKSQGALDTALLAKAVPGLGSSPNLALTGAARFAGPTAAYGLADYVAKEADLFGTGEGVSGFVGRNIGEFVADRFLPDDSAPKMSVLEASAAYDKLPYPEVDKETFMRRMTRPDGGPIQMQDVPESIQKQYNIGKFEPEDKVDLSSVDPSAQSGESLRRLEKALSTLGGTVQTPSGELRGIQREGGMVPISQELYDEFNLRSKEAGQPTISADPMPGLSPMETAQGTVYASPGLVEKRMREQAAAQAAPQAGTQQVFTQQQPGAGSPQANFLARKATGEPLSPQEIAQAMNLARSMNSTFDPETGYSRPVSAPAGASRGPSDAYARAQMEREQRMATKPDFMQATPDSARGPENGLFKDSELRKIFGENFAAAKALQDAGINPLTNKSFEEEQAELARVRSQSRTEPTEDDYAEAYSLAAQAAQARGLKGSQARDFINQFTEAKILGGAADMYFDPSQFVPEGPSQAPSLDDFKGTYDNEKKAKKAFEKGELREGDLIVIDGQLGYYTP